MVVCFSSNSPITGMWRRWSSLPLAWFSPHLWSSACSTSAWKMISNSHRKTVSPLFGRQKYCWYRRCRQGSAMEFRGMTTCTFEWGWSNWNVNGWYIGPFLLLTIKHSHLIMRRIRLRFCWYAFDEKTLNWKDKNRGWFNLLLFWIRWNRYPSWFYGKW